MKKLSGGAVAYLFAATYLISYITRINYGAVLVEMVKSTGFSNASLSVALTGSFITYGVGQIISGFMGDKIQPKRLVFAGLLISVFINIIIPFCNNPIQMAVLWSVNGFAQAFMWPPMVRLMVNLFEGDEYRKASVKVSYGSSAGTIVVFLISPLLISLWGWKSVFWVSAVLGVFMLFVWQMLCPKIDSDSDLKGDNNFKFAPPLGRFRIDLLFVLIMMAIVLQGALRDGVTTWTPTYIDDMFKLGSALAILTSVVLPIFSMVCHGFGGWLYYKVFKSPVLSAGVIFGVGSIAAAILYLLNGGSAVISIVCLAVLVGAMHGVNLMLICMVPSFYKSTGKISLVSGLLNSCTYVGSAVSTYGIALLTDNSGWSVTVGVWALIAVLGTAVCFVTIPLWNRKFFKNNK
ncbi:MAG: MFS transporter [Clostridia bacterium]|nr:MFS transporter [Clostridia bacterium]